MKGVAKVAPGVGNVQLIDAPEPEVKPGTVLIEVKTFGPLILACLAAIARPQANRDVGPAGQGQDFRD